MKRHGPMIISTIIVLTGSPFIFSLAGAFFFHTPQGGAIFGLMGGIFASVFAWWKHLNKK